MSSSPPATGASKARRPTATPSRGRGGAWSRVRSAPRELAVLLAVAAVLATAWAVALPPLQGPDEFTHVNYAQQLAENGRGPYFDRGTFNVSTEIGAALAELNLRALIGIPATRAPSTDLEERFWEQRRRTLPPDAREDGTGPSPLARNPQLYYALEVIPYAVLSGADLFDRLIAMRLVSAVFFVLMVLWTWLLATEVFGRRARLRVVVATSLVALWPMLAFMGGVVNPDIALAAVYTLVAWLAVRLVRRGPSLGRVVGVLLAAVACLLIHGRGVPAAGVAVVAIGLAWLRHRPPRRAMAVWAGAAVAAAAVPLLLSRVILPSSGGSGLYGGEANIPAQAFSVRQLIGQTWQFYFDRLAFMQPRLGPDYGYRDVVVERFVTGVFASLEVTFPTWVYDLMGVGLILLLIALWTAVVVRRRSVLREWPVIAVLATLALGLMALLHAASYRALLGPPDPLITGRYLLPLAPLIALGCAWLVGALPRPARAPAAAGLVGVMLLLQLGGLGMTVVRFHV